MYVHDLETPALVLDHEILTQNIAAMKDLLRGSRLALRPHFKSHKCAALAHLQIENGAVGMTCAKLSEALDLADSGIEDILIANQIVQPEKIRRLADLAGKCRLTVCVDDADNAAALSAAAAAAGSTVHCLIEFEIGMQRCGVCSFAEVLTLARKIETLPHLVFDGIQAYAGHVSHMENEADRRTITASNEARLAELLTYLREHGVEVKTVSGGSTGTAEIKAKSPLYTELQAGSYLFMDATYAGLALPFRQSLFLLSSVVSARDGLVVVDSGVKTCGVDQGMPAPCGMTVREIVASEEHFQLHGPSQTCRTGDKIRLIPGHCCSTVNLHDRIYLIEGERVIDRIPITGRGFGR